MNKNIVHFMNILNIYCTVFTVVWACILYGIQYSMCVGVDCVVLLYSLHVYICTLDYFSVYILHCTFPVIMLKHLKICIYKYTVYVLDCTIPVKFDKYLDISLYKYMFLVYTFINKCTIISPFKYILSYKCILCLDHVDDLNRRYTPSLLSVHFLHLNNPLRFDLYVDCLFSCNFKLSFKSLSIYFLSSAMVYLCFSNTICLHLNHKYASSVVFIICQYGYNPLHVRFTIYRLFSGSLNIRFKFTLMSSAFYLFNINCQLAYGAWAHPSFLYNCLCFLSSSNSPRVVFSVDCFILSRFLFLSSACGYFYIFNTQHPLIIAQPFFIVHDIFSLCIVWSPLVTVLKISNVSFCKVIFSNLPDNLSYK